jgi:hypothetical protein
MAIKCCKDCVAPKRHLGCHGSCAEYIAEKAEYDRLKEIYEKDRKISNDIYASRSKKVNQAIKYRRFKKM